MGSQPLQWRSAGLCPLCGVVTDHIWYMRISGQFWHPGAREAIDADIYGGQGAPLISKCTSEACQGLAFWIERRQGVGAERFELVYPQTGFRIPPAEGLEEEEVTLYKEAADVERLSPRAARALLRALLERFLKRHLVVAKQPVQGKRLVKLIDLAVEHLDLSQTLKTGLTAVREQGNTAMHDPYGLTDDASVEDLRWLFRAVDELVEELHVKPQRWNDLAGNDPDDEPF